MWEITTLGKPKSAVDTSEDDAKLQQFRNTVVPILRGFGEETE